MKVIYLNENDIKKLVKKIIKKDNELDIFDQLTQ